MTKEQLMEAACQGCRNIALDAAIRACDTIAKLGGTAEHCSLAIHKLKKVMNNHRGPNERV